MKIIALDTETTGLEQAKGHRIIEICLLEYDSESQELMSKYVQRINPERAIDPGAQAVHGISYTDVATSPKWEDVAQDIAERLSTADFLVAHNMGFDGPFIAAELQRVGVTPPNIASVCTMENARWACPDGKLPRLGELCFALGVGYDSAKAHAAEYDTTVTMDCFFRGLSRGFYQLPKSVRQMASFKNCHDKEGVPA